MKPLLHALPWLFLLSVVGTVAVDVVTARGINREMLASRATYAEELLGERRQPVTLQPSQGDDELRVWLFGASSFAAPDRIVFPNKLSSRYGTAGRTVVIDNLAWEGFTTADLARRAEQAAEEARRLGIQPDVAVFYEGHNDVTTTFHAALGFPAANPYSYPVSAFTTLPAWLVHQGWQEYPQGGGYRFYRNRRVGDLLRAYQRVGLLHVDPDAFTPLIDHIVAGYVPHIDQTRATMSALGADFIVVTPVGNLLRRPLGPIQVTDTLYDQAMATEDYDARMALLLQARDAETFTSDMRTKSVMIDALRRYTAAPPDPARQLRLCDLEAALFAQRAPMDDTMFVDPLHFSDAGFERLADVVFDCLIAWETARTP